MRKSKRSVFLVVCVLMINLACSGTQMLSSSQDTPEAGGVLFQDDFSDANSGWSTWSDESSQVIYQDGGMRFLIGQPQYDYWTQPGGRKQFGDVRIEVEAAKLAGPDDNDFGVICRYEDDDNFYSFLISSDGYAGIINVTDGNYTLISGKNMDYFEIIKQGVALNRISVECIGSTLSLTANGEKLYEVQDTTHTSGEVGLIAGAYDVPGVDIFFDNFIVYNP